jgi:hypothetical protein
MENNNVSITLINGLGDKLLDLIGFSVLCKYFNYKPNVIFCNNMHFAWGDNNYDIKLFNFNEITISDDKCNFYVNSYNPSASLCPYNVYEFIKQFLHEITFEQISNDFVEYSKKIIKPSEIILAKIPNNIEKAYGIHLRKSDKVNNMGDIGDLRHENGINEFEIITNKLVDDIKNIILSEEEPTFLIVSEDNNWKLEIKNRITNISKNNNKQIKILDIDYDNKDNYYNYNSVLDMFCLSKCKEILQGVKYSTFSILACLLGNNKLRNYSKYTDSYDICLIHIWSSVIEINNNNKNFDIELHKKITNGVVNIETNINKIFI